MNAVAMVDEALAVPSRAPGGLLPQPLPVPAPALEHSVAHAAGTRRFSIYAPLAAFDLIAELDFLARRAVEPNVFFAPQFLVPAMPRLDDRSVRLMVVRDETDMRSRLRLLMPYSVERAGLMRGPATIRAWTHPFGPLGTLLLDEDDPQSTVASLFEALARPSLGLPDVLVLPDLRIGERMAQTVFEVAERLGLSLEIVNRSDRAAYVRDADPQSYVARAVTGKRRREFRRQERLLAGQGAVGFSVARTPGHVRHALEDFLALEASGWKGRARSAMLLDRYRSAFAREAVDRLAAEDRVRIFTLTLAGTPIASLVGFQMGGEFFAWKTAYDEAQAPASPGLHLMTRVTEHLAADPGVKRADSCAVPDHFLMNRVWKQRIDIATLVVGLRPAGARRVEAAARGVEALQRSRNVTRLLRERVSRIVGRS
ncbi:GNAT family N-acetyltransferase [Aurantimonas sp. MSK8Z-1]|uniref:GNAT family N-acetyltransferase n=1 Tax=Mangrovibrevibacter kandeliae TaxID=2968473 RepID=UPI002118AD12|nr:GNAT family N-acetyltransferase [Aurantimonas sp. MSK8Z-1]MCW4116535.1 GNAT family N-acetyltransferase [Aurantimonas sp. MSK8Z-1]